MTGSVSSSFRHGIWMISFIGAGAKTVAPYPASAGMRPPCTRHPASQMEGLTLTRRPARARVRALDADTIAASCSRCCAWASRSGSSSTRPTPTTTRTTRCCGAARCSTSSCRRSRASALPTEHPLAIAAGAVLSLFGEVGDRLWVALILASFLWLVAGVYRLGRIAFTPLVGGIAAALLLTRFDFALPGRARLHRHPVHGDRDVGGGARGAAPAARHARCSCCSRRRPAAPGGVGAGRPVLAVAGPARDLAAARRLRRAGRARPARVDGAPTSSSPATRCSRCTTRAARPRTSGASARSPSCRPRSRSSSPTSSSCRC